MGNPDGHVTSFVSVLAYIDVKQHLYSKDTSDRIAEVEGHLPTRRNLHVKHKRFWDPIENH